MVQHYSVVTVLQLAVSSEQNLNMVAFCLIWWTCSTNTNMFVVNSRQLSEITNVHEHNNVQVVQPSEIMPIATPSYKK